MQYAILDNGNLKLTLEDDDIDEVTDILEAGGLDGVMLAKLFEYTGWSANGHLYVVGPEDVGAMTEAPIISDDVDYRDDGSTDVRGNVWWFPNYMVRNFCQDLLENREVVFTAAPENKTRQ